jgi:hypothetical protein
MDTLHRDRSRALSTDETGAVFAEYLVVFLCATLLVAVTVASVGLPLLSLYVYAETIIGLPIP